MSNVKRRRKDCRQIQMSTKKRRQKYGRQVQMSTSTNVDYEASTVQYRHERNFEISRTA